MSNGQHTDWLSVLWEAVKFVLGGLGTVASSVVIWLGLKWRGHLNMLKKHEQWISDAEKEMGHQRAFRELANKGPIGIEAKRKFRRVHKRISKNEKAIEDMVNLQTAMATNIDWIKDELQRRKESE